MSTLLLGGRSVESSELENDTALLTPTVEALVLVHSSIGMNAAKSVARSLPLDTPLSAGEGGGRLC